MNFFHFLHREKLTCEKKPSLIGTEEASVEVGLTVNTYIYTYTYNTNNTKSEA